MWRCVGNSLALSNWLSLADSSGIGTLTSVSNGTKTSWRLISSLNGMGMVCRFQITQSFKLCMANRSMDNQTLSHKQHCVFWGLKLRRNTEAVKNNW